MSVSNNNLGTMTTKIQEILKVLFVPVVLRWPSYTSLQDQVLQGHIAVWPKSD